MIFILILFGLSLFGIIGLLVIKVAELRAGGTPSTPTYEHHVEGWPKVNLSTVKSDLADVAKDLAHELVLKTLKLWIKVSYFVKKKKEVLAPKINAMLPKKHEIRKNPHVSEFLDQIKAYKAKIKKMTEHIKREEESKFPE